jgi:hypothetical protein
MFHTICYISAVVYHDAISEAEDIEILRYKAMYRRDSISTGKKNKGLQFQGIVLCPLKNNKNTFIRSRILARQTVTCRIQE